MQQNMNRIVLDPIMDYLDGPTLQHVRDVLALRISREFNDYITTSKALTRFWVKVHRRTSHGSQELSECYDINRLVSCTRYWHSRTERRDLMRSRFGECDKKDHCTFYVFQPVEDGEIVRTRQLYTEWRALAYKRFGRTWTCAQEKKLARLRATVAAMEAEKAAFEKRKAFYDPLVKAENKRVRDARGSK